jgi:predicted nucleotidyltransferase
MILFIFGSFAYQNETETSDLDIGVMWKCKRIPCLFTELYSDIQSLPTVRKIDLVDMDMVDNEFKEIVMQNKTLCLLDYQKLSWSVWHVCRERHLI